MTACLLFLTLCAQNPPAWPMCEVRSGTVGGPAIVVDGNPKTPMFFSPNNQFGRDEVLLRQLRQAADAGIPFFTVNMALPWWSSDEEALETLARFCEAHPDGHFLLRLWLGPNREWMEQHPDECITKADGERIGYASSSSRVWRDEATAMLRQRIQLILESPHAPRFLGVALHHLNTAEWFYPETDAFMDYSPANLHAFRKWLQKQYKRDKNLQKSWKMDGVELGNATFPTPELRTDAAWGPFRNPDQHQAAMDMQRFQSEMMADTIAHFARVVKEVTEGRSLTAAFYGYTFELNHNGPRALAHSGHLALEKMLQCKELDIILAPYAYFERKLGEPGHFHLPVDSVALHGKLAVMEEDTFTHLAMEVPEGIIAPGWQDRPDTLEGTLALFRRNAGNFLTHRCGFWIFDLLSDGRWDSPEFWKNTLILRRMAAELRSEGPFRPEVAFLADERAVHDLRADTHPWLLESLARWRSDVARIGAPVGYYLQSDLPRLPDSVKVVILANPYRWEKADQRAVDRLWRRGGTVIWTYAPGIMGPDGPDPARVAEVTGFPVSVHFDSSPIRFEEVFTGETRELPEGFQPRFIIGGDQADVVARYADTGAVAAAARQAGRGVAIYSAVPRLSAGTLRTICERAGVHLYRDTPGMVGVVGPYLILHTGLDTPGPATHAIHWPKPYSRVDRLVPDPLPTLYLLTSDVFHGPLSPGTTAIFRFEP